MFIIYANLAVLNVRAVHSLSSLTFPIPSTLLAALVTRHKQLHFCLVPGYLHSWLSNEQRVSINELKSAWFSWLNVHRSSFLTCCLSEVSAHTDVYFASFGFKTPSSWTTHKCNTKICKRTEAAYARARTRSPRPQHTLQNELLKSQPWNLPGLSSIAELKVHVFKGFETSRGFVLSRRHQHCAAR